MFTLSLLYLIWRKIDPSSDKQTSNFKKAFLRILSFKNTQYSFLIILTLKRNRFLNWTNMKSLISRKHCAKNVKLFGLLIKFYESWKLYDMLLITYMYIYVLESQIIHNQKHDRVLYVYAFNNYSVQPQAHAMIKREILKALQKKCSRLTLTIV